MKAQSNAHATEKRWHKWTVIIVRGVAAANRRNEQDTCAILDKCVSIRYKDTNCSWPLELAVRFVGGHRLRRPHWLTDCLTEGLTSTWLICATLAAQLTASVCACVCILQIQNAVKWSGRGSFVRLSFQVSSKSLRGFINDVRQPFSLSRQLSLSLPFLSVPCCCSLLLLLLLHHLLKLLFVIFLCTFYHSRHLLSPETFVICRCRIKKTFILPPKSCGRRWPIGFCGQLPVNGALIVATKCGKCQYIVMRIMLID